MKPTNLRSGLWWRYNALFLLEHLLGISRLEKWMGGRRRRLVDAIHNSIDEEGDTQPVPELDPASIGKDSATFKGPLVFRGAAADWQCTKNWTLDFFEQEHGDYQVAIRDLVGIIDPENPQKFRKISMREYIGLLKNGTLEYLKFSNLVQKEKRLQMDLDLDWIKRFDRPASTGKIFYLFIGGPGSITPLHNEFPAVVYIQVKGRKKWTMYLPEDRVFLDPRTERKMYFYSHVNPDRISDEPTSLARYATKYEVILEAGDVLWFPPFAWHYVENLTESIGVAYKFANLGLALGSSKILTSMILTATKPNPFFAAITSRIKKDDYVLANG